MKKLGSRKVSHWFFGVWVALLGVAAFTRASESLFEHLVQEGQTLSQIAQARIPGRIYGKKGNLLRLIKLNPHISDPSRIAVGQKIILPPDAFVVSQEIPDRSPAAAIFEIEESNNGFDSFELTPEFVFTRIDATDKRTGQKEIFLSNLSPGLTFRWIQGWSEQIQSLVFLGLIQTSFETNGLRTLDGSSQARWHAGMASTFSLGRWIVLNPFAQFRKEFFNHAPTASIIAMRSIFIPEFGLRAGLELAKTKQYSLLASTYGFYALSGDTTQYSIEQGWGYGGSLAIRRNFENWHLSSEVRYELLDQGTSLINQSRQDFGILFRFGLDLPHSP